MEEPLQTEEPLHRWKATFMSGVDVLNIMVEARTEDEARELARKYRPRGWLLFELNYDPEKVRRPKR